MKNIVLKSIALFTATSGLFFGHMQAASALLWNWNYSAVGISAAGTFNTTDTADSLGFYQILGITGQRNGDIITGLQTTGTPIPGNEPFNVDNLIRLNGSQLSGDGFGYATAGGNFASPFFASFLPTPGYLEVFSAPPLTPGFQNLGTEDSELEVSFAATPVPESSTSLSLIALTVLGVAFKVRKKREKQ